MNISDSQYDNMDLIPEDHQLAIDFLIKFSNSISSAAPQQKMGDGRRTSQTFFSHSAD